MRRRDFIWQSLFGIGGILITPSIIKAINTSQKKYLGDFNGKVIIVGAGAAGLYAAYILNQKGIDVTILEASDVYGGRLKSLKDFSDFPIELGAEEVRGKSSHFSELLKSTNTKLITNKGQNYFSLDGFLNIENQLEDDEDFKLTLALSEVFAEYTGTEDITLEQFVMQQNLSKRTTPLYNALVGNKLGTSIGRLSMLGLRDMEKSLLAQEDKFLLKDRSILSVFEEKFAAIFGKIKLNAAVTEIDYTNNTITVTDKNGGSYTADKVIITVPVTILRSHDIRFTPPLPTLKQQAFSKIGMGAGMKIILKFSKRFWKDDAASIYGNGYVPEFYATGPGKSTYNNILTAFINGENAEHLSFEDKEAVPIVTKELDKIFGSNIASRSLVGSYVMDWSKEPYIRGSYSYQAMGIGDSRLTASLSLNEKLYFAGEAMHTEGNFATVQGAMETAQIAVDEILKA